MMPKMNKLPINRIRLKGSLFSAAEGQRTGRCYCRFLSAIRQNLIDPEKDLAGRLPAISCARNIIGRILKYNEEEQTPDAGWIRPEGMVGI